MCYRMARDHPELFAAIAPVAGTNVCQLPTAPSPRHRVPTLHICSADDPRVLYQGGLGPPFPFTNIRHHWPPLEESFLAWAKLNGCQPVLCPVSGSVVRRGTRHPAHTATLLECPPGSAGSPPMRLLRLTGAGHGWPGMTAPSFIQDKIGEPTDVVDATEEVWRFFCQVLQARRPA